MATYMETVAAVIDGDTFKTENRTVKLIDVFAPELNTDVGSLAKMKLESILGASLVEINTGINPEAINGMYVANVWRSSDSLHINYAMRTYLNKCLAETKV